MTAPATSRIWPGDEPETPPHPAPEVECRLATADEIPRGARPIQRLAKAHGWTVVATYARGTRRGRMPRIVDSLALRMGGPGKRYAVAVWLDGRVDCAFTHNPHKPAFPRRVRLAELRAYLAGDA